MIAEAALGIAAGTLLAGGTVGLCHLRRWERSARAIAIIGAALAIVAAAGAVVESSAAIRPRMVLAVAVMITGGAIYSLRVEASSSTLIVGGLFLAYVTLANKGAVAAPLSPAWLVSLVTSGLSLPAIDAAVRELRTAPVHFHAAIPLWAGLSIALVASVAASLMQRGVWLGTTPDAAWSIAAWAASSGSLLTRRGRPRAILMILTALAAAFGALSS